MFAKLAAIMVLAFSLSACANTMDYSEMPSPQGRSVVRQEGRKPIQCAPYAREHSKVKIFGDAYTWWDQAGAAHYPRSTSPSPGAVMVLAGYSSTTHAHVAVVRRIVSSREIRIDHANWLNNGAIFMDDPVADISPNNDWTPVLVWNVQTHAWGVHTYNVTGFIEPKGGSSSMRVASSDADLED